MKNNRSTPEDLRAEATRMREQCARILVHAEKLDREADALEATNKALVEWFVGEIGRRAS